VSNLRKSLGGGEIPPVIAEKARFAMGKDIPQLSVLMTSDCQRNSRKEFQNAMTRFTSEIHSKPVARVQ
jgi:hypothetical protein